MRSATLAVSAEEASSRSTTDRERGEKAQPRTERHLFSNPCPLPMPKTYQKFSRSTWGKCGQDSTHWKRGLPQSQARTRAPKKQEAYLPLWSRASSAFTRWTQTYPRVRSRRVRSMSGKAFYFLFSGNERTESELRLSKNAFKRRFLLGIGNNKNRPFSETGQAVED